MKSKSFLLCLLFSLSLSLPVFSLAPKGDALNLITSMQIDLDLLSVSISNYKVKINELQNLIDLSVIDLQTQEALLKESQIKLASMETQYSELKTLYDNLNYSYKRSCKIIKYGGIATVVIIVTQGIVIALK